jgi:hypothetical protein
MNRLNQRLAVSNNDQAINSLQSITRGLTYDKESVSLSAPNGGKLSGKTNALTWECTG